MDDNTPVAILLRTDGSKRLIKMPAFDKLSEAIGCIYFDVLLVKPFCFTKSESAVKYEYVLVVDEEALTKDNFRSNAIGSALYNPYKPNKLFGDILICKYGLVDLEGLAAHEAATFLEYHPIFQRNWRVCNDIIMPE